MCLAEQQNIAHLIKIKVKKSTYLLISLLLQHNPHTEHFFGTKHACNEIISSKGALDEISWFGMVCLRFYVFFAIGMPKILWLCPFYL